MIFQSEYLKYTIYRSSFWRFWNRTELFAFSIQKTHGTKKNEFSFSILNINGSINKFASCCHYSSWLEKNIKFWQFYNYWALKTNHEFFFIKNVKRNVRSTVECIRDMSEINSIRICRNLQSIKCICQEVMSLGFSGDFFLTDLAQWTVVVLFINIYPAQKKFSQEKHFSYPSNSLCFFNKKYTSRSS